MGADEVDGLGRGHTFPSPPRPGRSPSTNWAFRQVSTATSCCAVGATPSVAPCGTSPVATPATTGISSSGSTLEPSTGADEPPSRDDLIALGSLLSDDAASVLGVAALLCWRRPTRTRRGPFSPVIDTPVSRSINGGSVGGQPEVRSRGGWTSRATRQSGVLAAHPSDLAANRSTSSRSPHRPRSGQGSACGVSTCGVSRRAAPNMATLATWK